MKTVQESIQINQQPALVFALLADPQQQMKFDGDMMRSCEKISEGPIRKGTRFRGNFKGMGTVEYEYGDYAQDRLIEHAVKMPFGAMHHRFEFVPSGNGTTLTQSVLLDPGFLGLLLWPLMMKGMMTKRIHSLNGKVKKYAEGLK